MNSKLRCVVVFGGSFYTVARIFLHLAFEVDLECKWEFEAGHLVPADRGVHITTRCVACPDWVAVRVAPHYTARIISMSRR